MSDKYDKKTKSKSKPKPQNKSKNNTESNDSRDLLVNDNRDDRYPKLEPNNMAKRKNNRIDAGDIIDGFNGFLEGIKNNNNSIPNIQNDTNTNDDNQNKSEIDDAIQMTHIDKLKKSYEVTKKDTEDKIRQLIDDMNIEIASYQENIDKTNAINDISEADKEFVTKSFNDVINNTKKHTNDKINILRDNLVAQQKEITNEETLNRGKNWDVGNIDTLNTWIRECNKQQFIYESVLEKIISRSQAVKITLLVLGAIMSLITVSNTAINDTSNIVLLWSVKIGLLILSTTIYILTQFMALQKFEDSIKNYTLYTEEIEKFLSILVTTADIKTSLRPNGDEFISENQGTYAKLYRDSPYIKQTYWKKGNEDYNAYLINKNSNSNYHARRRRAYERFAQMDRDNLANDPLKGVEIVVNDADPNVVSNTRQRRK